MMLFTMSFLIGFASHFGVYDVLKILPFPELAQYAFGVLETYPLVRQRIANGQDLESAYFLSFLGVGCGVLCGRIVRGFLPIKKAA